MKTIVVTAYAVDPYKGSEEGMGWHFIKQIARYQKVIAITRENNIPNIKKFLKENPIPGQENVTFYGYDLPKHLRFWKRGAKGSMPYFYLWQLTVPRFIKQSNFQYDLVHNLNFHNDWAPSFLWKLSKPFVWGPIGHHPEIPRNYLEPVYGAKAYRKHKMRWWLKQTFWKLSPALRKTAKSARVVLAMNSTVSTVLPLQKNQVQLMPSVGSEHTDWKWDDASSRFDIISIGRFVPLKGFDVTIRSFAAFFQTLSPEEKHQTHLTLVGKGPDRPFLEKLAAELKIEQSITFIHWIERNELEKLYRNSHVFLFPSHEGAGMVVSEAMSYGLPVICFDNSGPGEFVTPESGLTVPYDNYADSITLFAQHLEKLFRDRSVLKQYALGARKRFESYFDWDVKGEVLKKMYERIDV